MFDSSPNWDLAEYWYDLAIFNCFFLAQLQKIRLLQMHIRNLSWWSEGGAYVFAPYSHLFIVLVIS